MAEEKIGPDYDRVLKDFKGMRTARIKRQVRNCLQLIGLSVDERILEIGGATGKFSSIMSKSGNKVYTLDISLENLLRAKKAVAELGDPKNLFCINADCGALPFANFSFDKVTAIDIIEHIPDSTFAMFCKEAYRVLKPNGSLYIYTPNLLHPYELARPFRPVLRREHIGVRTRARICHFLRNVNFIIEKGYFSNFFRRISVKALKP